MSIFRKPLALLLALILATTLVSCTSKSNTPQKSSNSTSGDDKIFSNPTEISIAISSHASWPYNENWEIWKYFQEATGATFKITTMPGTEVDTKVTLMMATQDSLPDLLHLWDKKTVDRHASSGAFVSLSDNLDKLPNYKAFWETFPEEERNEIMAQRTSGDGKVYSAPVYGTHTVNNLRSWMYRKDIFEKNGLKPPKTFDELYQVAKQLKKLYPDSYPLCFRTGLGQLDIMGASWKNDFTFNTYYDFKEKKWCCGALDPVMKDVVQYFIKMYHEGLVPPDYLTMKTKSWEELMSTNRGFMSLDYIVRLDFFNIPNRLNNNPDFTLAIMEPPVPNIATAQKKINKTNLDFNGYVICNTGKKKNIDNAFKLLDWMYTDKGSDLLSWGKEGETYKIVNGNREFILKDGETPTQKYGVGTYGLYQRISVDANEAIYSKEQVEQSHKTLEFLEPHANPVLWLPLNEEEASIINNIKPEIDSFIEENLSKFLLEQQPMSKWDSFQASLKEMGVDKMLQTYSKAYTRVMNVK